MAQRLRKSLRSRSIADELFLNHHRASVHEHIMRALDIQLIGNELAIRWADGSETFFPLEKLRRACPCAGCHGEMDILGNVYKNPDKPLGATAFELRRFVPVGGYAIQFFWGDGHNSGIFAFDYLKRLAATV